jgi:pimeloyl-ACP methyl ester carboxylesterase
MIGDRFSGSLSVILGGRRRCSVPPTVCATRRCAGASARATLVWSLGNAGNIAGRADVLLALVSHGFDVLAYDYRGYGKSQGRPSEAGVYLDAAAAFDSERAYGTPSSRIVCFGESLGGAVSIRLATERPCAAVVVVSAFGASAVARITASLAPFSPGRGSIRPIWAGCRSVPPSRRARSFPMRSASSCLRWRGSRSGFFASLGPVTTTSSSTRP